MRKGLDLILIVTSLPLISYSPATAPMKEDFPEKVPDRVSPSKFTFDFILSDLALSSIAAISPFTVMLKGLHPAINFLSSNLPAGYL